MARRREEGERVCDLKGCSKPAVRSISAKKFSSAMPDARIPSTRRVHICKDHYKKYRKKTKKDRKLQRLDW
ncbi:MAG: hypothetical protein ACE5KV_06090 [Thermoplasmata archaeon]